jgi:hypothetical protein
MLSSFMLRLYAPLSIQIQFQLVFIQLCRVCSDFPVCHSVSLVVCVFSGRAGLDSATNESADLTSAGSFGLCGFMTYTIATAAVSRLRKFAYRSAGKYVMTQIHLHICANGQATVSATADPMPTMVSAHVADTPRITREQALAQILSREQMVEMITVPGGFVLTTILTTP